MNTKIIAVAAITLMGTRLHAQNTPAFKDQKDKVSYSIGLNIGTNFKRQGIEISTDMLLSGIKDAISGGKPALTDAEVQQTLMAFQQEMMAKQAEKAKGLGEKNKKDGEAFLAANKKKDGVKTTASGLQYKVLVDGKGKKPTADDTVRVHYRGTLIDGTEFDSSYKRNEPAEFPLNGVIPGWTEAVQLMTVGSKWQIVLPSALAYGERGQGQDIGPAATLLFDIELLAIIDGSKAGK
jgi:FKBP-type peptidyl-prolyl cis-trans isomerase FklB